jgi:hypothetical protein
MTWVKIDDSAASHPKLIAAGPEAAWMWHCGLGFSNRHHTDGRIPVSSLGALYYCPAWTPAVRAKLAARLVKVRLWVECPADDLCDEPYFLIHDYGEHQEEALKSSHEVRKEAARLRKREERERKKTAAKRESHTVTPRDTTRDIPRDMPVTGGVTSRVTGDVTSGVTPSDPVTAPRPDPSRPVPDLSLSLSSRDGATESDFRLANVAWQRSIQERGGMPTPCDAHYREVADVGRAARLKHPTDPEAACKRWAALGQARQAQRGNQVRPDTWARWVASELAAGREPGSVPDEPASAAPRSRRGFAEVPTAAEFDQGATDITPENLAKIFGPKRKAKEVADGC